MCYYSIKCDYFLNIEYGMLCWIVIILCDLCVITWLEARLQQNIGFTLRHVLAVFTCSAITPLKVNQFG